MQASGPFLVPHLRGRVDTTWAVPGSKSITNRALVCAALAEGDETVLRNVLASDDTQRMRDCLGAMGVAIRDGGADELIVRGGRDRLRVPSAPCFVGNSGTTVRFCAALAALIPGRTTFVGDQHMAKRPIADLVDGLRQLGVTVDCATGCPPLTVHGGRIPGGRIRMRGDRSSQYFTALLLVSGFADAALEISVEGELVSLPYIEMTRRLVADFGGRIDVLGGSGAAYQAGVSTGFRTTPIRAYRARGYAIEPDASSASYPFALAAAGGGRITVPGLDATSLQGDYAFVELLRRMGASVTSDAGGTSVAAPAGGLAGIDADLHHISDTVMTLAAIAPLCRGDTVIRNIANIRIKETDRLAATVAELRRLGQQVEHGDDWLRISPRPIIPATVECYADHRMAMSFGVLGALTGKVTIADPACTAKTYPGFWRDLATVAATVPA